MKRPANPPRPLGHCRRSLAAALVLTLGAQLAACSAPAPVPTAPAAVDAPGQILAQIDRLIGEASCTTNEQCQVAPIGWRPCGGAASYRAWSITNTDATALRKQLDRHGQQSQLQQQKEDLQSTCQVLPRPSVICQPVPQSKSLRCVLKDAADGVR